MFTIHKWGLEMTDMQVIKMPRLSSPLTVQIQNGGISLWAMVDTRLTPETNRMVYIVGTGNPMPDILRRDQYVGTVQHQSFVWHVFVV